MNRERRVYAAYMLRLWFENDDPSDANQTLGMWRASLEHPRTHEMQVFADLESLYAFLMQEIEHMEEAEEINSGSGD